MPDRVQPSEAWDRVNAMARSQGLSLPRAVSEGTLTRSDLAACVSRCQACAQVEACAAWLATHPKGDIVPDYCQNKARFGDLGKEV
ncbi:MAG: hypothetical protein JNN06_06085 [Gemmobacter sp.]|uniref:DUF6455 family protein n=1 Tax=Gemmobacter sp. TaxID=1898957 RepID=UPI001A4E0D14|nr:DUF6455 family protein [Gemmobacter sp.]MBL8561831.1 hypothetical protein [Gemmobacter sp.]